MNKTYRIISLLLIVFFAIFGLLAGIFCCAHKLWIKSARVVLSDNYLLLEGGEFDKAAAGLALADVFFSDSQNQNKINEQKAIIAARNGEADLALLFFNKAGDLSELGNFYHELVEILEIRNWKLDANIFNNSQKSNLSPMSNFEFLISQYNNLDNYQLGSPYRELVLSQILIELDELRLAKYALNKAVKKDPDYRDAHILLKDLYNFWGDSEESQKEAEIIRKLDPDYSF